MENKKETAFVMAMLSSTLPVDAKDHSFRFVVYVKEN